MHSAVSSDLHRSLYILRSLPERASQIYKVQEIEDEQNSRAPNRIDTAAHLYIFPSCCDECLRCFVVDSLNNRKLVCQVRVGRLVLERG